MLKDNFFFLTCTLNERFDDLVLPIFEMIIEFMYEYDIVLHDHSQYRLDKSIVPT